LLGDRSLLGVLEWCGLEPWSLVSEVMWLIAGGAETATRATSTAAPTATSGRVQEAVNQAAHPEGALP
jgi:hypothetical protein